MERRTAERYIIDLKAETASHPCSDGGKNSKVRIRDISGVGASFYDTGRWCVGDTVSMAIYFADDIVGPFSYTMRVKGRIVREAVAEAQGKPYFAVAFDSGFSLSNWMEIDSRGKGVDVGSSRGEVKRDGKA